MRDIRVCAGAKRSVQFMICGILLAISGSPLVGTTFERTFGGDNWDFGYSALQTPDGGYAIVGYTYSTNDVYFIKTDSLGNSVWQKRYGGPGQDIGYSLALTASGGYVITGCTESFGAGLSDLYFIETDSLGVITSENTYGSVLHEGGGYLGKTQDGGYAIVGYEYNPSDGHRVVFVKTDSTGDSVLTKTYDLDGLDFPQSVCQTFDGGYIILGQAITGAVEMDYTFLLRTDSLGDSLWVKTYGDGTLDDGGFCVLQVPEGDYVLAGRWGARNYLMKTDTLGTPLWIKSYGTHSGPGYAVRRVQGGGYILAGGWMDYPVLVRTDSLGDTLWMKESFEGWSFMSVEQTFDGGYIIGGYFGYSDARAFDVYLVKTDENGIVARDAGTVSINAPVQDTVFTDSTYPVTATVHNYRPSFVRCWVTASIGAYADSTHTGRLLPDSSVQDLKPDETTQVDFRAWQVPSADSTIYGMTVCIHAAGDVDTMNDCIQKTIFAYDPTGVQSEYDQPVAADLRLWENSPDPFDHSTVISYSQPSAVHVTLEIYDITGRLVETLVNETQEPGIHQVRWSRKDSPNGVYFYRIEAGGLAETGKMVVVE